MEKKSAMELEAIQPGISSSSANNNLNQQTGKSPSTNGHVVTVELTPRQSSTAFSTPIPEIKVTRKLSQPSPQNQPELENQQTSTASSSANVEQDPISNNLPKKCNDFDDIMENITSSRSYQWLLLLLVFSPISAIQPILAYNGVFMLDTPDHWCTSPDRPYYDDLEEYKLINIPTVNGTDGLWKYSSCTMKGPFHSELQCPYGWEFDKTNYQKTMVSENNWVCNNSRIPTLVFLSGTIGNAIGMLGFGLMSDRWGRKPTLFTAILTNVIFRLLSLFCGSNWILLCAAQFFAGGSTTALYVFPSLIAAELCNKDDRAQVYAFTWTVCLVGLSTLPIIAWMCGHWFYIGLYTAGLGCLMLLYYPFVPESPRWLLQKGRLDEAADILTRLQDYNIKHPEPPKKTKAKKNKSKNVRKSIMTNGTPPTSVPAAEGTPTGSQNDSGSRLSSKSVSSTKPTQETRGLENIKKLLLQVLQRQQNREESVSIREGRGVQLEDRSKASVIFTRPNLAKNTILLAICWSMNTLIYSAMTYNATHMLGSHFKNFFLLGVVEVPSGIVGGYLTDKLGRRWTQTGAFGLCSLACFATSVMVHNRAVEVLLATLAKMLVTVSFLVVYCQATELFPTELRSTGNGIVSTVGNFVSITAPVISELSSISAAYPWLIMGCLAVVGMVAGAFLPETVNLGLPETIEEADAIGKNRKFWSISTGNEKNSTEENVQEAEEQ